MAGGPASTQRDARQNWVSAYPFELISGGLGAYLACTSTSARVALPGIGNAVVVTNTGSSNAWFALGSSSVTATTSYVPILAGTSSIYTIPSDELDTVTHAAGITLSGETTSLNFNRGYGN